MVSILISVLVFLLVLAIAIIFAGTKSALEISRIEQLEPVGTLPPEDVVQWAQQNGFKYVGAYRFNTSTFPIDSLSWQHNQHPVFFVLYFSKATGSSSITKSGYDLVTLFHSEIGLTSSTLKSSQFHPPSPGSYKQSFPNMNLDQLLEIHNEMTDYLIQQGGTRRGLITKDLQSYIMESIHKQTSYIFTLKLWQIRIIYWYLIRQNKWKNLSIRDQHNKRWIKLPNETDTDSILRPT